MDTGAPLIGLLLQVQTQVFLLHRAFRYAAIAQMPRSLTWLGTAVVGLCILVSGVAGTAVSLEFTVSALSLSNCMEELVLTSAVRLSSSWAL